MHDTPYTADNPLMMRGTSKNLDYLCFARRGNIAMGIKPERIKSGALPNTTFIGGRLRAAPAGDLFEELDAGKPTSIADAKISLNGAWPEMTWQNMDSSRLSTTVGVHIKGTFDQNPDLLYAQIKDGKLAEKFAAFLVEQAGAENLIMPEAEIAAWMSKILMPVAEQISKQVQMKKDYEEEVSGSLGVFGVQAKQLKEIYAKHYAPHHHDDEVEDVENEHDDGDGDEADEG